MSSDLFALQARHRSPKMRKAGNLPASSPIGFEFQIEVLAAFEA
jgi:hypothetical protein